MREFTPEGLQKIEELAHRYGVSRDAVLTIYNAITDGYGTQAQFSHPDLGGMGQWSQGGMIMIGDMFNQGLKYKVQQLCEDMAGLMYNQFPFKAEETSQPQSYGGSQTQSQGRGQMDVSFSTSSASSQWWPEELGTAASVGSQNDLRYAYFPATRRLAIRHDGRVSIYDTGNHNIGGFSQQQGGDQSLTFTSQFGIVRVADLPVVTPGETQREPRSSEALNPSVGSSVAAPANPPASAQSAPAPLSVPMARSVPASDDILSLIEKLADLRQKNILTEEEFAAKKSELLGRL
jgi:Short C-terminal domain